MITVRGHSLPSPEQFGLADEVAALKKAVADLSSRLIWLEGRPKEEATRPTPHVQAKAIVQWVADRHGILPEHLMGPSPMRHIAWARQEAFYEIVMRLGWSQSGVGRFFKRDHSTVKFGIEQHKKRVGL